MPLGTAGWKAIFGQIAHRHSRHTQINQKNVLLKNKISGMAFFLLYDSKYILLLWRSIIDSFRASWSTNINPLTALTHIYTIYTIIGRWSWKHCVHEQPMGRVPTSCQQLINRSGPSRGNRRGPRKRWTVCWLLCRISCWLFFFFSTFVQHQANQYQPCLRLTNASFALNFFNILNIKITKKKKKITRIIQNRVE